MQTQHSAEELVTISKAEYYELVRLRQQVYILQEQLAALKKKIFGRKSEKTLPDAPTLFDDPGALIKIETPQRISVPAHTRRKPGGRKPISDNLPRVERVVELSAEEKICKCCGSEMVEISKDTSERVEVTPPKIYIEKLVRPKCVCRKCNSAPVAAAVPYVLPHSIVANGALAYIATAKFCDAIPFYRLEKIMARYGIELPADNMSNYVLQFSRLYGEKILRAFEARLRNAPLLHIDETSILVMREENRANTQKSYVWTFRSHDVVLFHYRTSRSADFLRDFLRGYRGRVLTDGYTSYDHVLDEMGIVHAACHVHCRRNFVEAHEVGKDSRAAPALEYYRKLYRIEAEARAANLSGDALVAWRQEHAKPLLREFHQWLNECRAKSYVAASKLGKAVHYALRHWPKLVLFLGDAAIPLDNNPVENAIRPYVIGRKNWLIAGSPSGADANCLFYSLVETARLNSHEPYQYLRWLFDRLPYADDDYAIAALMPFSQPPP